MVHRIRVDRSSCSAFFECTCGARGDVELTAKDAWAAGHRHALQSHPGDMSNHVIDAHRRYKS